MATNGANGDIGERIRQADQAIDDLEAEAAEVERRLAAAARYRQDLVRAATDGLHRGQMTDKQKSEFIRSYPDGPAAGVEAFFKLPL